MYEKEISLDTWGSDLRNLRGEKRPLEVVRMTGRLVEAARLLTAA